MPVVLVLAALATVFVGMGFMGIYSLYLLPNQLLSQPGPVLFHKTLTVSKTEAQSILKQLRKTFQQRYGSFSTKLMDEGVEAIGSIDATALRMLEASQQGRPFVLSFSGYSVTVGRGNFFNQSFPFAVQRILGGPMEQVLGIPLVVRNAAIGGIPSFPYGFCLEHFVGADTDVLSWDYSMNEGKGAAGLEAFVRQALQQLPHRPMIIKMDPKGSGAKRTELLKKYASLGLVEDALTVGLEDGYIDDNVISELSPLPPGFQEWDQHGAPKSCPGRSKWHPKRQEHSMLGWMIAMHFVRVLERALELKGPTGSIPKEHEHHARFPKPISVLKNDNKEVKELLLGHVSTEDPSSYIMKDLSCRTSFEPATDTSKTLASIVVSGLTGGDLDIMHDRSMQHYQDGWVFDVSKTERDTKRKVERCGGLGYIDLKTALYGIPESGTLRLWLPFEGPSHADHSHGAGDDDAKHWFDDLLICEANEKRDASACKLNQDLEVIVGGVPVTGIHPLQEVAKYLKRETCVNVGIPVNAKVTKLANVVTTDGKPLNQPERRKLADDDDAIGVVVDVKARSKVTLPGGACCLSHIVWEMH